MKEETKPEGGFVLLPLEMLRPFDGQPFRVRMDESMAELVESIKSYGVLTPIAVRRVSKNEYEILAGHRRTKACELAGRRKMPSKILELNDDMAIIYLVDSNLQREHILPSEKAFAYQMKLDAMKRQGMRTDLTSSQIGRKSGKESREILAEQVGESRNQISRYIRLTHLVYQLLDMVDNSKLSLNAAVELSYLGSKAQAELAQILQMDELRITIKQASAIRAHSEDGKISFERMQEILKKRKDIQKSEAEFIIKENRIRQYFPPDYSSKQIEKILLSLVKKWALEQNTTQQG